MALTIKSHTCESVTTYNLQSGLKQYPGFQMNNCDSIFI